jgi:hypothetical protein
VRTRARNRLQILQISLVCSPPTVRLGSLAKILPYSRLPAPVLNLFQNRVLNLLHNLSPCRAASPLNGRQASLACAPLFHRLRRHQASHPKNLLANPVGSPAGSPLDNRRRCPAHNQRLRQLPNHLGSLRRSRVCSPQVRLFISR